MSIREPSGSADGRHRGIGRPLRWIVRIVMNAALVSTAVLLVWAFASRSMPAVEIWHTGLLENEFGAGDATSGYKMQDYLDQEKRLFSELHRSIYDRVTPAAESAHSRYRIGGPQDPMQLPRNWNRTFELVPETIRGGVLLLHGLSDSPYSLRRVGEIHYEKGFYVFGLRLPGHGTIPGALTEVGWKDWVAASRLAGRYVRERIGPDKPFVIAGYSNGGALTVKYALDALFQPDLPQADQLMLFSPEIGITPFSAIANAHKLYSFIPYFEQSKWLSIHPEYDPFKYNSFPKNAGQQSHEITAALQEQLKKAFADGKLTDFPPVTTFLSWVDSTVETSKTIDRLYGQLENPGSELVIFDVNRSHSAAPMYPAGDAAKMDALQSRSDLPYRLTVITNASPNSRAIAERTKAPRSPEVETSPLKMAWPPGIYSLSHVAIPFSPDDPVYGSGESRSSAYKGIPLGSLQPRGETNYLAVPLSQFMRLRYNPFFGYVEKRIREAIEKIKKGES